MLRGILRTPARDIKLRAVLRRSCGTHEGIFFNPALARTSLILVSRLRFAFEKPENGFSPLVENPYGPFFSGKRSNRASAWIVRGPDWGFWFCNGMSESSRYAAHLLFSVESSLAESILVAEKKGSCAQPVRYIGAGAYRDLHGAILTAPWLLERVKGRFSVSAPLRQVRTAIIALTVTGQAMIPRMSFARSLAELSRQSSR